MTYRILNVPLTEKEWRALTTIAQEEYRNPKQQAAFLLRLALGLDRPHENDIAVFQPGIDPRAEVRG
jgi:hypothetical protein